MPKAREGGANVCGRCVFVALVLMLATLTACAHATRTRSGVGDTIGSARVVLTAAELAKFRAANSLMEALDAMHPRWLTSAGRKPKVSIDGGPPTQYSALYFLPVYTVLEVSLQRVASVGQVVKTAAGYVVADGDLLLVRTK